MEQKDVVLEKIKAMNIFQRVSEIAIRLPVVPKNLEVGKGQSKYNAVSEADVLAVVKPLEYQYRVFSYATSRKILESQIIESEQYDNYTGKSSIKKIIFERIETTYRFVNIDNPDDYIETTTYGDGMDSQDKSVGKATTYSDKYALLKSYKMITGDDPDQYASEPIVKPHSRSDNFPPKDNADISKSREDLLAELADLKVAVENIVTLYKANTIDEVTDEQLASVVRRKKKQLGEI